MIALWFPVWQRAPLARLESLSSHRLRDARAPMAVPQTSSTGLLACRTAGLLPLEPFLVEPCLQVKEGAQPIPRGLATPTVTAASVAGCVGEPLLAPELLSVTWTHGHVFATDRRREARGRSAPGGKGGGEEGEEDEENDDDDDSGQECLHSPPGALCPWPSSCLEPVLALGHMAAPRPGTAPTTEEAGLRQKALAQGVDSAPALPAPPQALIVF